MNPVKQNFIHDSQAGAHIHIYTQAFDVPWFFSLLYCCFFVVVVVFARSCFLTNSFRQIRHTKTWIQKVNLRIAVFLKKCLISFTLRPCEQELYWMPTCSRLESNSVAVLRLKLLVNECDERTLSNAIAFVPFNAFSVNNRENRIVVSIKREVLPHRAAIWSDPIRSDPMMRSPH